MVIATTGVIYLSQFNTELGKAVNTPISLNQADLRQMLQIPSGTIYMSSGRARGVGSGAYGYGPYDQYAVGVHTFYVPWYNTMYVQVWGAGAGGTGGEGRVQTSERYSEGQNAYIPIYTYYGGSSGGYGGTSVFYSSTNMIGYGGGPNGAQGTGSGGSYVLTGGGYGGGIGGLDYANTNRATSGGAGGTTAINFTRGAAGAPVPYTEITIVVGGGGGGGAGGQGGGDPGAAGSSGRVYVSWS